MNDLDKEIQGMLVYYFMKIHKDMGVKELREALSPQKHETFMNDQEIWKAGGGAAIALFEKAHRDYDEIMGRIQKLPKKEWEHVFLMSARLMGAKSTEELINDLSTEMFTMLYLLKLDEWLEKTCG